jgi:Flp pilus assembly protein TadG
MAFRAHRRGNVALTFALAFFPLMVAAGSAFAALSEPLARR